MCTPEGSLFVGRCWIPKLLLHEIFVAMTSRHLPTSPPLKNLPKKMNVAWD